MQQANSRLQGAALAVQGTKKHEKAQGSPGRSEVVKDASQSRALQALQGASSIAGRESVQGVASSPKRNEQSRACQ